VNHHSPNPHPHLHTYPFLLTLITVSFSKLGYVFLWILSICVECLVEIIPMTMISSYLFHRLFVLINIESASSLCLSCLVFPLSFFFHIQTTLIIVFMGNMKGVTNASKLFEESFPPCKSYGRHNDLLNSYGTNM